MHCLRHSKVGTVGSNALLRRYVHGPGSDEPLVWYEGAGVADKRYLHADERGSVVAITNSGGTSIATNSYDDWGNLNNSGGAAFSYDPPKQFTFKKSRNPNYRRLYEIFGGTAVLISSISQFRWNP